MRQTDGIDPELEASLRLCCWLLAARIAVVLPLLTAMLLAVCLSSEVRRPGPRSAWTTEFEFRPLSDLTGNDGPRR